MSADDDDDIDLELEHRGRGRPRLPPDQKRREKISISVTAAELGDCMHAAADVPVRLQDWARDILLAAARAAREKREKK